MTIAKAMVVDVVSYLINIIERLISHSYNREIVHPPVTLSNQINVYLIVQIFLFIFFLFCVALFGYSV